MRNLLGIAVGLVFGVALLGCPGRGGTVDAGGDVGTDPQDAPDSPPPPDAPSPDSTDAADPGVDPPAPDAPDGTSGLHWYYTCGDPVCRGWTPSGNPLCTTEVAGQPCNMDGALCDPMDGCNAQLVCSATDPTMGPGGCPISRAAWKRDIHYLGPAEIAQLSDELMRMRLATFRYRRVPDDRLHLGFLIDDQEPSMCIDPERDMVDLYGYTSMAVAALQAQSERIGDLERQVSALRERLDHQRPAANTSPRAAPAR